MLFQNFVLKQALTKSHNKYVLVPFDNATGNVAVIYLRFCASTLIKPLGFEISNIDDITRSYET